MSDVKSLLEEVEYLREEQRDNIKYIRELSLCIDIHQREIDRLKKDLAIEGLLRQGDSDSYMRAYSELKNERDLHFRKVNQQQTELDKKEETILKLISFLGDVNTRLASYYTYDHPLRLDIISVLKEVRQEPLIIIDEVLRGDDGKV